MAEKKELNSSGFISIAITILVASVIGLVFIYVINRDTFEEGITSSNTYTSSAKFDPNLGIVIGGETESGPNSGAGDGTESGDEAENESEEESNNEVNIKEIFESLDGASTYLKDDEESTKEQKLQYLLNAELVTKFPYIKSLEGDESKLNGRIKFYRFTSQLEADEAQSQAGESENNSEETTFNPQEIFYIGDSWMAGLRERIKSVANTEYKESHFLCEGSTIPTSPIFEKSNIKTKIDAVSSEISHIVIMLGLNGANEYQASKMNEIIEFLSTTYSDKTIYVLKVPHVGDGYTSGETSAIEKNLNIDSYNAIVLEKCSEIVNAKFIDSTSNMMTEELFLHPDYKAGDIDEGGTNDGEFHLNYKGLDLWYSNIKECIKEGKSSADVEKFEMIFLAEEDFEEKYQQCKASENKEIFKYFTINEENEIVIATWSKTSKTVKINDPEVTIDSFNESSSFDFQENEEGSYTAGKYTISKTELIDYNTLSGKYALPFNLLWAFLVETKSYDLTKEIAQLAYESEIHIGIYENETTTQQSTTQEYNKKIRFTEATTLTFPAIGETTPSIDINNSRYEDVIKGCLGRIVSNGPKHNAIMSSDFQAISIEDRNDGHIFQYYVSEMTEDGIITGVTTNEEEAEKYSIATFTTRVSSTSPAIGIFYVDNWMATWTANFQLTLGEITPYSSSSTRQGEYETFPGNKISNPTVEAKLTLHSERLKTEAINEIVRNTGMPAPRVVVEKTIISTHLASCYDCRKKIEEAYNQSWGVLIRSGIEAMEQIYSNILNDKDYSGTDESRIKHRQVYEHTYEKERAKQQEAQLEQFKKDLKEKVRYTQNAIAERKNLNIEYSTASTKTPYAYEKAEDALRENIGKKFKEIITKEEHYESMQAIKARTLWFWEYIREAEDTVNLENLLRIMFNEAFETDEFGTFDQSEIDAIFKAFEPKLRKAGMTHSKAFSEWIKSYENNTLRLFMNDEGIPYESVERYVTEDREYGKMYFTPFDGCWNFTYGIMVCDSENKLNNKEIFERYEYDLEDLVRRAKAGETVTVLMEDLEDIYEEIISNKRNSLKTELKDRGVEPEIWETNALLNFCYQWGNCGQYLEGENNIAEVYKKYCIEQEDLEGFRENAVLKSRSGNLVHFFNAEYKLRQENAWIMFSEGRYILSDGEEIFVSGDYAELILDACAEVTQELIENNIYYYTAGYPLFYMDVVKSSDYTQRPPIGTCCATYVGNVLYKAEIFTVEYMDKYNINFPGNPHSGCNFGIYKLLADAGWEIVEEEDAQPGDICVWCYHGDGDRESHAFIYAGDGMVWDQSTGCIGSDKKTPPTGGPIRTWNNWCNARDIIVFRTP